jgi:nicotinate dehydrogenase subunit A
VAKIRFKVNGRDHQLDVDERTPLIYVLRNDLDLKGTKLGCGLEQCGACKVIVDGKAVFSCNSPVSSFENCSITTIEGLGNADKLHPIQESFVKEKAAQCGYCIPGIIMAAKALLDTTPYPDKEMVCEALADNLCRCGTHPQILKAVMKVASEIRK